MLIKTPLRTLLSRACLVAWSVSALGSLARAAEVTNVPEVGAHQPILLVEKNVHPQNWMVVYTKLDAQGRFMADPAAPDRPLLDFYWLMDGRKYKAVNALIRYEIRQRFTGEWSARERSDRFSVNLNELKEVQCDIKEPRMEVYVRTTGAGPRVDAEMNLGPSDGNLRIRLSAIYTEGRTLPPTVDAVTLKGEEIVNGSLTGRKVARTYYAPGRSK